MSHQCDCSSIKQALKMLGYRAMDRVTGMEGVITSISFDLYGCIQAVVNPGLDEKGEPRDSRWFDLSRLELLSNLRVMEPPAVLGLTDKGPEVKPPFVSQPAPRSVA